MKDYKILLQSFLIGFISLSLQVIAFEQVFNFFLKSSISISISTSTFLLGIALSSYFNAKLTKRFETLNVLKAMIIGCTAYSFILLYTDKILFNYLIQSERFIRYFSFSFYFFIPAYMIGGSFPILASLYNKKHENVLQDTSKIYFIDTIGAVIGSLLIGSIFIPNIGVNNSIYIIIALEIILLLTLIKNKVDFLFPIAFTILLLYFFLRPVSLIPYNRRFGEIKFQKPSPYGVITAGLLANDLHLYVNYRLMCKGNDNLDKSAVKMSEQIMKQYNHKIKILNIGLGCGKTAEFLLKTGKVDELHIAEINEAVIQANREIFKDYNSDLISNPNVKIINQDGALYLRESHQKYDLIIIDVEEISIQYSSPLYTFEYFKIIKEKLNPNGNFVLWSATDQASFKKILYNTISAVFSKSYISDYNKNVILYGGENLNKSLFDKNHLSENITNLPYKEINTIDNKVLLKHFNLRESFYLPKNHYEKFLIDSN